jgi:UDP-N-acetyl-D-glucosamine dehydrogenase
MKMIYHSSLLEKIKDKSAKISVIGCGFVGASIASAFSQQEYEVTGYELSSKRIAKLRDMMSKPEYQLLRFEVNDDPSHIRNADVVIICVPTPLSKRGVPDMSSIEEVLKTLKGLPSLKGKLIILESTVPIGVTRGKIAKKLKKQSLDRKGEVETPLEVGVDVFVGCSPERVDPNNKEYTIHDVPKITSGITENCKKLTETLYTKITKAVPVSSVECAEAIKLLENSFRMVGIGLIQELSQYVSEVGLDIWEICQGAETKPFGYHAFRPSAGIGGHCIGIDATALAFGARKNGFTLGLVEKALAVHNSVPYHITGLIGKSLEITQSKEIAGSHILILGASYKPDVADSRESACRDIWKLLEDKKANVEYYDPLIPKMWLSKDRQVSSVEFGMDAVKKSDCVVICQPFPAKQKFQHFYTELFVEANAIVDCCNTYPKKIKFYHPDDESKRKVFSL